MKKFIYRSLATALTVLCCAGASAQLKTSYFMEGSIPRYNMNAALTPMHNYLNLPLLPLGGVGVDLDNNFLSIKNFLYPHDGGFVTPLHSSVDTDRFLGRLPARPNVGVSVDYNLLGFGKYNRRHDYFWSFGWNLHVDVDAAVPKELFRLLKTLGSGLHDMSDLSLNGIVYSEMALGYTMPLPWKNLVVGGRLKFLIGHGNFEASATSVDLSIDRQTIRGAAGATFRGTIPAQRYARIANGPIELDQLFGSLSNFSAGDAFNGYGAAIDLGAEMKLFDGRLKLSLAANDIGFIAWSAKNSIQGSIDDIVFEYKGINTGKSGDLQDKLDIVKPEAIVYRKSGNAGYTRSLAATMNIGAEWNFLDNLLGVGVLSHTEFGRYHNESELTLTGTVRPAGWFTAALSHSLVHNKMGIFGLALNFHPRGVNFFIGADYVTMRLAELGFIEEGFKWPVRANAMNVYMGLAFTLGGRSKPW